MPLYKTFGVDLGTSMIKIYSAQNDSILKEKNMIAIRNENQILASGNEAYKIYEKNPSNVSVIEPMAFGKIADINRTEIVLQSLLKRAGSQQFFGNSVYLAVPTDLSEIEKRAYYTIGNMIVTIGAQSTEISIIEKGRVVISKMVEVGGKQLNEAIISMVRRNCNLNIGERSAARLKLSLSYLKDDPQEVRKVVGVDWITGLPQVGVVTSDMVNEAIEEPFLKICEEIRFFLDRIPPQIYSNIADEGVFLIGGTTKIPGVGWFISQEVRIRVRLSKYHDLCTIYGIKEIIGNKTLWKWVK